MKASHSSADRDKASANPAVQNGGRGGVSMPAVPVLQHKTPLPDHQNLQPQQPENTEQQPKQFKAVVQLRWIHHPNSTESHWSGRRPPTQRDLAELARLGRTQVAEQLQSLSGGSNPNRQHGLFLAPGDSERGFIGAPFPLPQPSQDDNVPDRPRIEHTAWPHTGIRSNHEDRRRPERTINGGSAREQLVEYGLPDYPGAAHAHIQPDHAIGVDEEREDPANRHPSTEEANQQHTTREFAQNSVGQEHGLIIASRHLQGEQRPGLYSSMEFGSTFLTGDDTRTHRDSVPYFTHQPGRYGDENERRDELRHFGYQSVASGLRDSGFLDENDLPDEFYIPPDQAIEEEGSDGEQLDSEDQPMDGMDVVEPEPQDGGQPGGVAQGPHPNLNAGGMVIHYIQNGAIAVANAQGTYSPEFHAVRDQGAAVAQLLNHGGMALADAQQFVLNFHAALAHFPGADQGYVPAEVQEQILQQLGIGEQLLAIIRFLAHQ